MRRLNLALVATLLAVGTAACSSESAPEAVSGDAPELNGRISCAQEIALVCGAGLFDGCLEQGLTTHHVCVANADRQGGAPCAQEIARVCDNGLKDACLVTPSFSKEHICIQAANGNGTPGGDGGAGGGGISCNLEIALACAAGSFDGCLQPGLTRIHVCVANEDRAAGRGTSCALEILRVCADGFEDACVSRSPPANTHICVKK